MVFKFLAQEAISLDLKTQCSALWIWGEALVELTDLF